MERLFTPWRFPYVSSLERQAGPCVFCGLRDRPVFFYQNVEQWRVVPPVMKE